MLVSLTKEQELKLNIKRSHPWFRRLLHQRAPFPFARLLLRDFRMLNDNRQIPGFRQFVREHLFHGFDGRLPERFDHFRRDELPVLFGNLASVVKQFSCVMSDGKFVRTHRFYVKIVRSLLDFGHDILIIEHIFRCFVDYTK